MRFALLLAVALLALPAAGPATTTAAPPNDDFADAADLSAIDPERGFVRGANLNATKEMDEPEHAGNAGGRSVWYTWTAPGDGSIPNVAFTTGFPEFDTLLGVYTGPSVDDLIEVASNDDEPGSFFGSSVSFATDPGETYRIAVDGFGGKSGRFFLGWRPSPPNDNLADAIALAGAAGQRTGDSAAGATAEHGEDVFASAATVWYSWQPPADGTYKLDTVGSRFDTFLAVYAGSSYEDLDLIAANDDDPDRGCCSSWVPLVDAEAATTYLIQVSPLGEEDGGPLTLNWGPLILGTGGPDLLEGTPGAEEIRGRGGADRIFGRGGDDILLGGRGNDILDGGPGADVLFDRTGLDVLRGRGGNDRLDARDRRAGDVLVGGGGNDVCRADRGDTRRSC
jgi:Ca2+-binding RTX toxin-like protein